MDVSVLIIIMADMNILTLNVRLDWGTDHELFFLIVEFRWENWKVTVASRDRISGSSMLRLWRLDLLNF